MSSDCCSFCYFLGDNMQFRISEISCSVISVKILWKRKKDHMLTLFFPRHLLVDPIKDKITGYINPCPESLQLFLE